MKVSLNRELWDLMQTFTIIRYYLVYFEEEGSFSVVQKKKLVAENCEVQVDDSVLVKCGSLEPLPTKSYVAFSVSCSLKKP